MEYSNKDLIQSYILTQARYKFTVPEKRILYGIIELMQHYAEGKKLDRKYSITKTMFDDVDIVMPISKFLKDAESTDFKRVKKALLGLNSKVIQYEDGRTWRAFNLIERPAIEKYDKLVSLRISPEIAKAFNDFSKGFSKYEYQTIMAFDSTYAMRFYELLGTQTTKISYSIDKLKLMFGIENKYTNKSNDFIRFVVKVAQKELDEKSPVSFLFEARATKGEGKKITTIDFYPVKRPENRDPVLEQAELQKQISLRFDIDKIHVDYLKEHFLFSDSEIRKNIATFKEAQDKLPDFIMFLSFLRTSTKRALNQKGAVINALKKQLNGGKLPKKITNKIQLDGLISNMSNAKKE